VCGDILLHLTFTCADIVVVTNTRRVVTPDSISFVANKYCGEILTQGSNRFEICLCHKWGNINVFPGILKAEEINSQDINVYSMYCSETGQQF